jgi:hypothetical protein
MCGLVPAVRTVCVHMAIGANENMPTFIRARDRCMGYTGVISQPYYYDIRSHFINLGPLMAYKSTSLRMCSRAQAFNVRTISSIHTKDAFGACEFRITASMGLLDVGWTIQNPI